MDSSSIRLTVNFSLSEFLTTSRAEWAEEQERIPYECAQNLRSLCKEVLQPLRTAWGQPLVVSSGYRCAGLNAVVGGASTSQHLEGKAADIVASNPYALAALAKSLGLPYDQMGLYGTFVHLSYDPDKVMQRGQIFYDASYTGRKL